VQRLADRLEDDFGRQAEQRSDSRGRTRTEVGDVVDLVGVKADRLDEVDLDLVAGHDALHQLRARPVQVLRHGEDRRDVVAGM
jgi:hypothetical protein